MSQLSDYKFLKSVGGRPVSKDMRTFASRPDSVEEWNFGLLTDYGPQELQHTPASKTVQRHLSATKPRFQLTGRLAKDQNKVILSDVFKHPTVQKSIQSFLQKFGGRSDVFPGFHQLTGSCVGTGAGNDATIAAAVEVAWKGDPELPVVFFWPYHYARGRFRGGMTRPGAGSFSEAQVEAFLEDGTIRADIDGIPVFKDGGDGLVMPGGGRQEMEWSDGDASNIMTLLETGRENRFKTSSVIRSWDDARDCIRDAKMPFLFCGSLGGIMECPIKGNPPCLLNRRGPRPWMHNQTGMAWWDHPELGELLGVWNQWGLKAHGGPDPGGLPWGASWYTRQDAEYQIRQGSCIVVSSFDGHPALDLDFDWTA